jgi:catechol 2,3-dioxygenase-like lactoylglutathione lyase family enzyme
MENHAEGGAMASGAGAAPEIGLTFDCADPRAQARFWTVALGYAPAPVPEGWDTWEAFFSDHDVPPEEWGDGAGICDASGRRPPISFLKVPEAKRAKNRLHLDVKVSGGRHVDQVQRLSRIEAKVVELLAAGAAVQARDVVRGRLDHVVMLDPEGNEFCVV